MGHGPAQKINFETIGRDPAWPPKRLGCWTARPGSITFSNYHGPTRPGASHFQKSRSGPAQPIMFSKYQVRPGQARPIPIFIPARLGPVWTTGPWQALFQALLRRGCGTQCTPGGTVTIEKRTKTLHHVEGVLMLRVCVC